jgi:hypothetical protein
MLPLIHNLCMLPLVSTLYFLSLFSTLCLFPLVNTLVEVPAPNHERKHTSLSTTVALAVWCLNTKHDCVPLSRCEASTSTTGFRLHRLRRTHGRNLSS